MNLGDKFPDKIKSDYLNRVIQRGCIIRMFVKDTNPPKVKRFIIVGKCKDNLQVATVYINSDINNLVNWTNELKDLQVKLDADNREYLDNTSYVDCSKFIIRDYKNLQSSIKENPEIATGDLSAEDLDLIINKIKSATNDIFKQINKELQTNKPIELTVKTYKPGSFDIYLQLLVDATAVGVAAGFFNNNGIALSGNIIDLFLSTFNLKKFLKGKKPKELIKLSDDNIKIKDNEGNVFIANQITLNVLENEAVDSSIRNIFTGLKNTPYVEGLTIKDKNNEDKFSSQKNDISFTHMIKESPLIEQEEEITRDKKIKKAYLSVYNIIFDDRKNWKFYYKGNKIAASLKDDKFINKMIKGDVSFANGSIMKCKLTIHQKLNKIANTYENVSYTITEVIKVIPRAAQGRLEF